MSTYELNIDGTSAETGARKIVKSFDDIKAAADRMEGGVSAAARKATASFSAMSNTRGASAEAINSIKSLSVALSSFKGPSAASVQNTLSFLNGLKAVGSVKISSGGLSSLLDSLSGFKGPSGSSAANTNKLLASLGKFSGLGGSTRGVAGILDALGNFKGPSAAGARNTENLLKALQNFTAPSGLAGVTRAFIALSEAANKASSSVGRLKSLTAGSTTITVNTSKASAGLSQLTKDHGILQNSIFKTQTALRSLGGILALKEVVNASNDILRIHSQLEAATGSTQQAAVQFEKLTNQADRMGLEFVDLARSYGFFLGSIKGTNVTFAEAETIFSGFSTAARALQLSTSDVDGVFRALGQIMSKGKLQAEELRGQLGDRLPGAFVRFARALDLTKPGELDAALKAGSISGDRLNKALIEVAQTMELEFAVSADKASKNVGAAFARLKNAFVFTSADLGKSGLNDFLISLADGIRKLVESDTLNKVLTTLGRTLAFLGDNIETVAKLISAGAVFAFLRWATAIKVVTGSIAIFSQFLRAMALAQAIAGVGALRAAWIGLNVVMRANVIGVIITALSVLTYWLLSSSEKADQFLSNLRKTGAASAVAANGVAAFTAELADNNGKLSTGNDLLRERIRLNLINQQQAFGRDRADLQYVKDPGKKDSQGIVGYRGGGANPIPVYGTVKGYGPSEYIKDSKGNVIRDPIVIQYLRSTGGVGRNAGRITARDSKGATEQYKNLYRENSRLGGSLDQIRDPKERRFAEERFNATAGYLTTVEPGAMRSAGLVPLVNTQAARDEVFTDPDRIRTRGGLSGSPVEKAKRAKKGASDAGNVQDIRRALDSLRDLRREVEASDAAIKALSEGSSDTIAVQAQASAKAKFDNFSDSFKTVELARSGITRLASQMKADGLLDANTDISSYEAAKTAIIDYTSALEELVARRKKDAEVATSVSDLRQENDLRKQSVEAIAAGGAVMEAANIKMEVEQQLIGTSVKNHDALAASLTKELQRRNEINRAIEQANATRELRSKAVVESEVAGLYGKGFNSDEIDYYRELYTERQRLINDGYSGDMLRGMLAIKQGTLDLQVVSKKAADEEEKFRQLAADQADAIVSGFKKGVEAGDNFLKTMKNIFNDLKNIFLDFVLYNPLREFLKDTLTNSPQTNSGSSKVISTSDRMQDGFKMTDFLTSFDETFAPQKAASSSVNSSQIANSTQAKAVEAGTTNALENATIVVTGAKQGVGVDLNAPINPTKQDPEERMDRLRKIFDYKTNGSGAAFKDLGKAIKGFDVKGIGKAIGPAIKAATTAFAAFSIGQSVGKALGLGRTGSNVLGGAAAGFSVGGPAGAAIGATIALVGSLLFKKKDPSSFGNVTVGANGIAKGGAGQIYGKGDIAFGAAAAKAGASLFNNFAVEYDANLKAGSYGTFGKTKFKGQKEEQGFYSVTGALKKGKPIGTEGVDYIRGSDSELQAFAIKKALQAGRITGLSPTLQKVGQNTQATSMEALQQDFATGRAYDEFIKSSFKISDVAKQIQSLNDTMEKLSKQSRELGLSEAALGKARDRIVAGLKKDFNFNVSQGILGIQDPRLAAFNALEKEYKDTVENGMAVGGDLLAVEKLYGLKRIELTKQIAQEQNNVYRDLLTNLTATQNSPLNADTVLTNARERYNALRDELKSGNTANIGNLGSYTDNYLSAAKDVNASSSGYFDIFNEVTTFLKSMSEITNSTTGTSTDLPSLPTLDAIIAEITARNAEMLDVQTGIGTAVLETGADTVAAIKELTDLFRSQGIGNYDLSGVKTSVFESSVSLF